MAITLDTKRPDTQTYTIVSNTIGTTIVENDTVDDSNDYVDVIISLNGLTPDSFTVGDVAVTNTNPDIVGNAGDFDNARPGDALSGDGTGIPAGALVSSVSEDGSTITMDIAATADGTETITVDPQTIKGTLGILRMSFENVNSTDLRIRGRIFKFDGSKVYDTLDDNNEDNVTTSDAVSNLNIFNEVFNIDNFLSKARV